LTWRSTCRRTNRPTWQVPGSQEAKTAPGSACEMASSLSYSLVVFVTYLFPIVAVDRYKYTQCIRSRQPAADPQGSPAGSRYDWLACGTPLSCRRRRRSQICYQDCVDV